MYKGASRSRRQIVTAHARAGVFVPLVPAAGGRQQSMKLARDA